jgi:GT2 family glycosyltransferase
VNAKVGIVIPTMGTRPDLLRKSLASIRLAGDALVHIVAPSSAQIESILDPNSYEALVVDPGKGLSAAINAGLQSFPESIEYVNWIGDDDLLIKNSLTHTAALLTDNPDTVLVYGGCEYIDVDGNRIWKNKSGKYASPLLHFGPQLIPQPGALMRRDAYRAIGGLNTSYKWAFDLDLLIRLKKVGTLQFVDTTLAKFRWHEGSLSVGGRKGSVNEASSIRRASLPRALQIVSPLWEIPMKQAILAAGNRLNRKLKHIHG